MKRTIKYISSSLAALTAAALLSAGLPAQAAVVSVNFIQNPGNDQQQIDADETFGISSEGTVVGGWSNVNAPVNNLADSAGNATTVNISSILQPNGQATFNSGYIDTPLYAGFDDYTATPTACSFTLTNLNANFPNGYKVIVYVGGFLSLTNASISDGSTTYFYRAANTATQATNVVTSGFSQTTQTTDLGGGNNPVAQYAIFGSPTLLTSDTVTFTINALLGGGSGLCGFQIVGTSTLDLAARIWKGNLNNDWNTSTFNWTNSFYGATNYAEGDPVLFTDAAVAASPTVNLTATRSPLSVTVDSTKNYTFTGSGIAGATGLTKKGSGSLTLSNPNTYTGNTVISAGALKVGAANSIPDGVGAGNVSVAATATLDLNGTSEGINGLSGGGTVTNSGGAATLTVGLNDVGGTFAGTLQGPVGFTKQGTNTLTLTNTTAHTAATTVGQGTLVLRPLSAFSTASALVVSNGANLEVSFTNGLGLSSSASLSLRGGTNLTVDYGNASVTASGTPITTSGALNLNGVTQIGIKGQSFGTGTFTIISYGSKVGAGSISATPAFLPSGMVATIQDTGVGAGGGSINLVVTTPSVQSLLWTQGDGEWSTNGLFYWNAGSGPGTAEYLEYPSGFGDSVSFDNSNFGTVTLPKDVKPFSVTVAGDYVLTGPGRITGATGITRSGFTGTTFVLDNTNTYTGVTTVSGGTLQINRPGALGSTAAGTVVESGAMLTLSNGITLSGEPLTLNGNGVAPINGGALRSVDSNSTITVSSPITLGSTARIRTADGGELILNGPITDNGSNYTVFLHAETTNSIVRMNSAGNVAGNLTVYGNTVTNRGRIIFGAANVFPTSSLSIGGGLFDLNGNSQTFEGLLAGFNPTWGVVTNSSGTAATLTINYADTNASAQMQSELSGLINVVKTGVGVQSFGGGANIAHSYRGTTTINGGVFGVSSDFSGVTNSFTVNSGGTLRGSANNIIGGPVTVLPGGTFYAGFASNQVGTLNISNNLALGGNLIVAIDKELSPSNDVVNVSGSIAYGGSLTVLDINTNGTPVVVGDKFRVFKTGGTGSFVPPITFLSLSNNTVATLSFSDGELTVTSVGGAAPTLTYTNLGAGVLRFSWSGAFKLQIQTNTIAVGLKTNWVDYPITTNPVNVTNNPAIGTTLFRLQSLP